MNKLFLILIMLAGNTSLFSQSQTISTDVQVKTALLAAPTEKKDAASVIAYNEKGEMVVLKKGSNEMYCLVDDAAKPGISVSCYHKDLQPFMTRGEQLRKEGKDAKQIFDIREAEVKSGKLKMPTLATSLFVFSGKDENFNKATGELKDGYLRFVVYIPYATPESTGLPLRPAAPGMPWIMHPGTHGAHIMINPPQASK